MAVTFKALDRINYNNLKCGGHELCDKLFQGQKMNPASARPGPQQYNAYSLQILATRTLLPHEYLVQDAIDSIPQHLMGLLLQQAVKMKDCVKGWWCLARA